MTKAKITKIVDEYKLIFNQEYNLFVEQQIQTRKGLLNEFASTQGDNVLERKLFDLPATLHSMFVEKLNKEEAIWFKSKEGGRWFQKTFIEFRASKKI